MTSNETTKMTTKVSTHMETDDNNNIVKELLWNVIDSIINSVNDNDNRKVTTQFVVGKNYKLDADIYTIVSISKTRKSLRRYKINFTQDIHRRKINFNDFTLVEYIYPYDIQMYRTGIGRDGMERNTLHATN